MKSLGIGVSTSVGIGGDVVNGSSFKDHLEFFEQDPNTHAVIIIGEIGGSQEVKAALWAKDNMTKPLVGYIAGLTAPKGKRMGHAGAIISGGKGTADDKFAALDEANVKTVKSPSELGTAIAELL